MNITAFDLAQRFVGLKEVSGPTANPAILAMLRLDQAWPQDDSVAWCSAFANYIAWLLRLPRSKDLRARSWLRVGTTVASLSQAIVGFDVCIFSRDGASLDPTVIDAPGHVGFYAGTEAGRVLVLGGNQGDCVCVEPFKVDRLLGVRRLLADATPAAPR